MLLGPAEVRSIADRIGLRPAKSLGQNFVIDPNTVRRIVRTAAVTADDVVLEVGPGLGSLTLGLLPAVRRVVAVEVDARLADALPATVHERAPEFAPRLTVVTADALGVTSVPGPPVSALVANLPYNVAVPVLLRLLERIAPIRRGLVMVQAEVAERLTAAPGTEAYGIPSVKLRWFADARPAGPVPRTVFWPAPRVDSALVAFHRHDPPAVGAGREDVFAVVDAAFAARRKTLRAALSGWAGSAVRAEAVLAAAGVDPRARGETLDLPAFGRIAAAARTIDRDPGKELH